MTNWTLLKGFPVIDVKRNYDTGITSFTQNKFNLLPEFENSGYTWFVPISYTSGSGSNPDFNDTTPKFWIFPNETKVEQNLSEVVNPGDWLIINVKTTGYYRVNYDPENWARIIAQLQDRPTEIHIVNRAQLLDDAMTLARASLTSYDLALNLTRYLEMEDQFLPWQSFLDNLQYLSNMALNTSAESSLKVRLQSAKFGLN